MAIISIDSLAEINTAGDEDVLLISTSSGAKKIKASAIGGSGSGSGADEFLIEGTISLASGGTITCETTIADIVAANTAGKNIRLKLVDATVGTTIYGHITYVMSDSSDDPEAGFMFYLNATGLITCNKNGWSVS